MHRITILLSFLFLLSCNSAKQAQKQSINNQIKASRIMFIIMPMKDLSISWQPFLVSCDTVFNKNDIATELLPFNRNGFNPSNSNSYLKEIRQFMPDCFVILVPKGYGNTLKNKYIKYAIYTMPIDVVEFLLPANSDYKLPTPTLTGSFKLVIANTVEKAKLNGNEAAHEFIDVLKTRITTIQ